MAVQSGSFGDITTRSNHVRFTPDSDRKSGHGSRKFTSAQATSGHNWVTLLVAHARQFAHADSNFTYQPTGFADATSSTCKRRRRAGLGCIKARRQGDLAAPHSRRPSRSVQFYQSACTQNFDAQGAVAFLIDSINNCAENGFGKKAAQPASIASLRTAVVSCAVMKITGILEPIVVNRRRNSMPVMPAMCMSRTMHITSVALSRSRNVSAELKTSVAKPDASSMRLSPLKTLGSSSTIATTCWCDKLARPDFGTRKAPARISHRIFRYDIAPRGSTKPCRLRRKSADGFRLAEPWGTRDSTPASLLVESQCGSDRKTTVLERPYAQIGR